MDKRNKNKKSSSKKVDNNTIKVDHQDYGYDFVPNLDSWLNIDEQREKVEELEDMSD